MNYSELMSFLGEVDLSPIKETNRRTVWKVVKSFSYFSERHNIIIGIPAGFLTDLASVPRIPIAWLLAGGTANAAAVVHDYLYHNKALVRAETEEIGKRASRKWIAREICDDIFLQAMIDTRVPAWRRELIFFAVRSFGWLAYRKSKEGL